MAVVAVVVVCSGVFLVPNRRLRTVEKHGRVLLRVARGHTNMSMPGSRYCTTIMVETFENIVGNNIVVLPPISIGNPM